MKNTKSIEEGLCLKSRFFGEALMFLFFFAFFLYVFTPLYLCVEIF